MSHDRNGVALPFNPPFAFCIFDGFLRFVMASPMLAKLTGYSVAELSTMGVAEIISLESIEEALDSLDHADRSGWSHYELFFYRKDGLPVKTHIDTIPIGESQYLSIFTHVQFQRADADYYVTKNSKLNCWEAFGCERQPHGARASEFGVCPAATTIALNGMNGGINGGRACWAASGTLCEGHGQGLFAIKAHDCRACRFYLTTMQEEGTHFAGKLEILSRLYEC